MKPLTYTFVCDDPGLAYTSPERCWLQTATGAVLGSTPRQYVYLTLPVPRGGYFEMGHRYRLVIDEVPGEAST